MRYYEMIVEANSPVPSPLYHVTPREFLQSIQTKGIEPRTGTYPVVNHKWGRRIFFNSTLMGATEMAMMFDSDRRHGFRDFVILVIDPNKIPEAKFRPDTRSDGVWTKSPVPPSAIIKIEEPDWDTDEFEAYMDGE